MLITVVHKGYASALSERGLLKFREKQRWREELLNNELHTSVNITQEDTHCQKRLLIEKSRYPRTQYKM